MNNVKELGKEKRFPKNGELCDRIYKLLSEYDGELSTAEAVGVLEVVKLGLLGAVKVNT